LGPFHISGTVEARNFKFGKQIGHWGSGGPNEKMQNYVKRGRKGVM